MNRAREEELRAEAAWYRTQQEAKQKIEEWLSGVDAISENELETESP